MKKLLTILAVLLVSTSAFAWDQVPPGAIQNCQAQVPYGVPQATKKVTLICRHAYVSAFDEQAKIPNWVSYTLVPNHALGCVPRSNAFEADASIKNSPTPQDYAGSGFDKGHNADDGDMSFDNQAELESFLMTNMSPQAPSLNRGTWKLLETSVRAWAYEINQPLTVYIGNLYDANDKTIGHGVVIPHALFKIVIDDSTNQYAAWLFPHVKPYPNLGTDLTKYRVTVAQIEQLSGIKFPLPQGATELAVGKEWPVDFGKLTKAKKATCGAHATVD
ncbi:MAG TPA: DNA/RNA non-specific endonuclease [Methanosarcina sp.]|nr:DNA/RNA non-specific endonuclease [Methanosarcina sp.]